MLKKASPVAQPSRVTQCGNPWHGLVEAGTLTTTEGAITRAWPNQADSGDAFLLKVPGMPTPTTTPAQTAQGMEWRNSAIISGWWERQLYGQPIPGANMAYLYSAGSGQTWLADLSEIILEYNGTLEVTTFKGYVRFRSTRFQPTPEAIVSDYASNGIDDDEYYYRDVVAINADGSAAIIGLWPRYYSASELLYSEAVAARGMGQLTHSSIDYRPPPKALARMEISLLAGSPVATIEPYMLAGEMLTGSESNDETVGNGVSYLVDIDEVATYTGPSSSPELCYKIERTITTSADYAPGEGNVGYESYSSFSTVETREIVGIYYDVAAGGGPKFVELVTQTTTASEYIITDNGGDVINVVDGSEWNGLENPNAACVSAETSFTSQSTTFTKNLTDTQSITVDLVVDGEVKSSVVASRVTESLIEIIGYVVNRNGTIAVTGGSTVSSTTTDSVTLDGSAPVELSSYGAPSITIPIQAAAAIIINNIRVHAVRYSNNAYGLAVFNLAPSDFFGHSAYLAGIVNLITGTKTAAAGWLDAPNDTIEYPYTGISVSVEPETGDIAIDSGCYV